MAIYTFSVSDQTFHFMMLLTQIVNFTSSSNTILSPITGHNLLQDFGQAYRFPGKINHSNMRVTDTSPKSLPRFACHMLININKHPYSSVQIGHVLDKYYKVTSYPSHSPS